MTQGGDEWVCLLLSSRNEAAWYCKKHQLENPRCFFSTFHLRTEEHALRTRRGTLLSLIKALSLINEIIQ